ncbi:glutamine-synthetase adenylyltransferase [Bifidobacterium dolichotidis]|uniref:Glutamine-synthetase adenylyltransferase n=1 Tax=Bifidobacterium dolichotidis TaxID=2306976 RepID=A0A430FSZ6_9BIFI|nr:bifunctional [glutamine synthetase] adenylyltransferase/[glutamine synthetase]-adenylyl-L-tyrosine phosphorylase [Bifidobacterium dolichotidis]RSX55998.1 glutamine-synthetase adenylyltransferase [Bifidobacterium dolichotidis]
MAIQDPVITTLALIHAGFRTTDTAKAQFERLRQAGYTDEQLETTLQALSVADSPDTALQSLVDIDEGLRASGHKLCQELGSLDHFQTLVRVLGASDALGKLMRTRPALLEAAAYDPRGLATMRVADRKACLLQAVHAESNQFGVPVSTLSLAEATTALRAEYREHLAAIMAQDVTATDPITLQPTISRELSDAADAALEAALAIARSQVMQSERIRFAVIGMGKLGARELNYVSDVDLIYIVEPRDVEDEEPLSALQLTRLGTKMATALQRVCQSVVAGVTEPMLWQIDGALRPEGKDGVLVRGIESTKAYYEQWAENWEFQALLKARPVAGDVELGQQYMDMTRPFVWSAAKRDNFVNDCQHMRERVEDLIAPALKDREIKLGKGGLRDVEFTVQMLQLVHGRTDESLRTSNTLESLHALAEGGYVSREQARRLSQDYRFERVLEHRQQMWMLKRTHLFPDLGEGSTGGLEKRRNISIEQLNQNTELVRLARSLHVRAEQLVERFDTTRQEIRRLHMDIYYRPMLPISASIDGDDFRLSTEATLERYAAVGFADGQAAMRHVQALTEGISRAAKINRILLPAVLYWLGNGQNPDMGLLNWRKLEEHFGSEHEYLGFLRDSPSASKRLCHVLSNSRFLGDALNKSLESITWLGMDEQLAPRSRERLDVQCNAIIRRYEGAMREASTGLRAMRRHEIERIGLGWLNNVVSLEDSLTGMTDVYDAILSAALQWANAACLEEQELTTAPAVLSIIAMGRYGGREVNFSSDADVIVIYEPVEGADEAVANLYARKVQEKLRQIVQGPQTLEPKIELDMDLRPEGKNGPLVRSYASCEEYYRSWASTWEHQALLRARFAAGDEQLAQRFLTNIVNPLRYSTTPLTEAELAEIRKLKARMEAERLPRGVHRDRHFKLGKGGLSDVEWTVQLLQLQHAGDIAELRTQSTMQALNTLESLHFINAFDAQALRQAWQMCTAARNGNYLWSGRVAQADILPDDLYSLGGIAVYLGYEANEGQKFENDILAVMRRARDVAERLFYERESTATEIRS